MNFSKIFKFSLIAVFFIGIISSFLIPVNQAKATINFCPQINIPGIEMFDTKKYPCTKDAKGNITGAFPIDSSSIAELAAGAYKFIAGIAGIAAVIVMMAGGYVWLFAGGNASKVTEAKSLITSAVLGLFLVLGSYMILNLINPELIKLKSLDNISGIKSIAIGNRICTVEEKNRQIEEIKSSVKNPTSVDGSVIIQKEKQARLRCGKIYNLNQKNCTDCMTGGKTADECKSECAMIGCMNIECNDVGVGGGYGICSLSVDKSGTLKSNGCVTSIKALNSYSDNGWSDFSIEGSITIGGKEAVCGNSSTGPNIAYSTCKAEGGACNIVNDEGKNLEYSSVSMVNSIPTDNWVNISGHYKGKQRYIQCGRGL